MLAPMLPARKTKEKGLAIIIVVLLGVLLGLIIGMAGAMTYGTIHLSQCRNRCKELQAQGAWNAECDGNPTCVAIREAQCEGNCNLY